MDTLIGLILKAGTSLAGISSAVFLMVHAEWLKLPIFSKLSQAQTFYILILSLVLTFVFSLTLLIVHLKKSKLQSGSATANGNGVAIVSSGSGNVQVNQSSK